MAAIVLDFQQLGQADLERVVPQVWPLSHFHVPIQGGMAAQIATLTQERRDLSSESVAGLPALAEGAGAPAQGAVPKSKSVKGSLKA